MEVKGDHTHIVNNQALVYIMEFIEQNWEILFKPKLQTLEGKFIRK